MAALLIRNGRVLLPSGWADDTDVRLDGGAIDQIGYGLPSAGARGVYARGLMVVPGFIDIHIHGAAGALCEDANPGSIVRISAALARCGVTGFLPTLATLPADRLRAAVAAIASSCGSEPGARILGIHLEGPYLSPLRAGAQAIPWMRLPSIEEFDELQKVSNARIRLVTVAPELDGALPFIAAVRDRGVTVAVGHSNATAAEMSLGIEAGATHVTHLFNAMRPLHHREPGVIGVALTDDALSVELICDGHHLAPRTVDLALRCKPVGKAVLVSDAVALGMPEGEHEMFGVSCTVAGGAVRLREGGNLAGSCLSLDAAVRNVHRWLPQVPLERVLGAAAAAPAAVINESHTGIMPIGGAADLTILDTQLNVVATIARGAIVWHREQSSFA